MGQGEANVLDNLIAKKDIPIMIGIGVSPGVLYADPPGTPKRRVARYNRSYEFDSINDHFPDYVLNELIPAVEKLTTKDGRAIHISKDGNDHAATGASTGGIGSFTLAWRRPDQFRRIYDVIGTFVSMRGGHDYPALIRKTEPKPIRIFLEDGNTDAWNPLFGSWFDANVNMESALRFAGYDVAHAWGTHGHNGAVGAAIFPDVMRWLWRNYPEAIPVGVSQNSALKSILPDNAGWETLPATCHTATSLVANSAGIVFLADAKGTGIGRMSKDGGVGSYLLQEVKVKALALDIDDNVYATEPEQRKIIAFNAGGHERTIVDGITAQRIAVISDGTIYASEPGEHSDEPSRIWAIKPNGEKKLLDEGLSAVSAIAVSPDHQLLLAAERSTQWIYSFVIQPDGTLADKQPFYWLHMADIPNESGAEDMTFDRHGELYVATRMGVQVCDQNGRVRAILPLPSPAGPALGLCFGGEHFDVLYATDGKHVYRRKLKVTGIAPSALPTTCPSEGAG